MCDVVFDAEIISNSIVIDFISFEKNRELFVLIQDGFLCCIDHNDKTVKWSLKLFKKGCARNLERLDEDCKYIVVSNDLGQLYVCNTEKRKKKRLEFQTCQVGEFDPLPISSICVIPCEKKKVNKKFIMAIGDDNGNIQVILVRKFIGQLLAVFPEHDDYISRIIFNEPRGCIVAASGDGSASIYDFKKLKIKAHTDSLNSEIQSMAIINEDLIVCGGTESSINTFKWGQWDWICLGIKKSNCIKGDITSILSHPSNDMIYAGTSEGLIYNIRLRDEPIKINHFSDSVEKIEYSKSSDAIFVLCLNNRKIYKIGSMIQRQEEKIPKKPNSRFFNDL